MLKYCYCFVLLLCVPKCVQSACDRSSCESCSGMTSSSCYPGFYLESQSCQRCSDTIQHCKSCFKIDGTINCYTCNQCFFMLSNGAGGECRSCNIKHCIQCLHTLLCTTCENDYYGSRCQFECSLCNGNTCPSQTCISCCIAGYYQDPQNRDNECLACREGCKHCTDYSYCTQCKDTYFNAGGVCIKCQSNCTSCIDGISCYSCKTGNWGGDCELGCSGCVDNACDKLSGTCDKGCINGYIKQSEYGHCTVITSTIQTCPEIICDAGNYCANGNCLECPRECNSAVCDPLNGSCVSCADGRWGTNCEIECSDGCLNTRCNKSTGHCNLCKPQFHGISCDRRCSDNCYDPGSSSSLCDTNGVCTYGCDSGFKGLQCGKSNKSGEDTNPSDVNIGIPIGVSVAAVITIIAVVLLYIGIKRRRRRPQMHTYENDNVITDIRQLHSASETSGASTEIQLNNRHDYVNQSRPTAAGMANPAVYESLSEHRGGDEHVYTSINCRLNTSTKHYN